MIFLESRFHTGIKQAIKHTISAPFIWAILFPVLITDVFLEIYHRICFPLYGIPYVKRSHYIKFLDRAKLPYLTFPEKVGCIYCGYMNGWFHYASVIAGKTESYWCAVAHIEGRGYIPDIHEKNFAKYGNEVALKRRYHIHEEKYGIEKK